MSDTDRADLAVEIARAAGALGLDFFRKIDDLRVERKGHQDFISQADREVELFVRNALEEAAPKDAIVGEEYAPKEGVSGFTWVIDPIDGTTNFISGIPAWTVVVAGVRGGKTEIGVIFDPCNEELYLAVAGQGATLNGAAIHAPKGKGVRDGSIGVGFSNRVSTKGIQKLVTALLDAGGVFHRNASGALSLAYVASGKLLGYSEEHMNAWDCLAGQLIVAEAGARVEEQDADEMIANGGRVIVGLDGVFDELREISLQAFSN